MCYNFGQVSEVKLKPKYCTVTYSKLLKIILKLTRQCTEYHIVYLGESDSSTQFSSSLCGSDANGKLCDSGGWPELL